MAMSPARACTLRAACATALAAVLAGCAAGPNFSRPQPPPATHYGHQPDPALTVDAHGTAQHFSAAIQVDADWWRLFGSEALDAVIAEAMANNAGLDAARANLRQSQDILRSGYGIFYPSLGIGAAAEREKLNTASFGQSFAGSIFNLFTLSASVGYALDVFGGEHRLVESLRAQADIAEATERGTYLAVSTNIVDGVIARAAYQAESEATEELVGLERQQVQIAEVQSRAGTVPYSTVLSLRSQLASSQALIPQLEQRVAQSDDLLATLAGYTPGEWLAPAVRLSDLELPADLPLTLPSRLVRQRPDILAAEATAHAASAGIGVATAAMLPSVTLAAGAANSTNSMSELFPAYGRSWNIGASATAPLFEGGTLRYRRRAAVEQYRQAMALYRQTVLAAFAQVADALQGLGHDAEYLAAEDDALASAREALALINANYNAGLATYLEVLSADAQFHQAQIDELQALALRYQDTVALYAALGGGWRDDPVTETPGTIKQPREEWEHANHE